MIKEKYTPYISKENHTYHIYLRIVVFNRITMISKGNGGENHCKQKINWGEEGGMSY